MDLYAGLAVRRCTENLALGGGYGGVPGDKGGCHAAQGLYTERQGGYIEEQYVLDLAFEYAALDGRPDGDYFIRVDALVRFFAEEFLYFLLYKRHTGLPADEDDLVYLGARLAGVFKRIAARSDGFLHQVCHKLF